MTKDQLRTKKAFFHLVYDRPEGCEKDASKADLCLSTNCRHCGKFVALEDADVIVGYWATIWFMAHKDCSKAGKQDEAIACQTIDADCNDCIHFNRGEHNKRFSSTHLIDPSKYNLFTGSPERDSEQQKLYILEGLLIGSYEGRCLKFDKSTRAWPGQATGHKCFEHRRAVPLEGQ